MPFPAMSMGMQGSYPVPLCSISDVCCGDMGKGRKGDRLSSPSVPLHQRVESLVPLCSETVWWPSTLCLALGHFGQLAFHKATRDPLLRDAQVPWLGDQVNSGCGSPERMVGLGEHWVDREDHWHVGIWVGLLKSQIPPHLGLPFGPLPGCPQPLAALSLLKHTGWGPFARKGFPLCSPHTFYFSVQCQCVAPTPPPPSSGHLLLTHSVLPLAGCLQPISAR